MTQQQLKTIIEEQFSCYCNWGCDANGEEKDDLLTLINQHVAEVIGEDEYGYSNKPDKQNAEQEIRSELRVEQRKRAGL